MAKATAVAAIGLLSIGTVLALLPRGSSDTVARANEAGDKAKVANASLAAR
jgi:hypothetical protein